MSDVKEAIIAHIIAADSSLTTSSTITHVFGSWNEDIWNLDYDNLPLVSVRIGPSTDHEAVFGRKVTSSVTGIYVSFFFTAHIFHTVPDTGDKSKTAMDLGETIKNNLLKVDDSDSGIVFYRDLVMRESKINIHNVARVIIEGYVFVRRPIT